MRLSKFHLIEGGNEIAVIQKKTKEIPFKLTKTIYNLLHLSTSVGKYNPKIPEDFSAGPSSWNNRNACRRDFFVVGYTEQKSPIIVWQDKKNLKKNYITSVDQYT